MMQVKSKKTMKSQRIVSSLVTIVVCIFYAIELCTKLADNKLKKSTDCRKSDIGSLNLITWPVVTHICFSKQEEKPNKNAKDIDIEELALGKTKAHLVCSCFGRKYISSLVHVCCSDKNDFQNLGKSKDLCGLLNLTNFYTSPAPDRSVIAYPVTQDVTYSGAGIHEFHAQTLSPIMQATDSTEDDEYIHPDRHVQQASENGIGMYLDNDEGGAFGFPLDQHLPDEEDAFGGTIHDPSSRVDRVVGDLDAPNLIGTDANIPSPSLQLPQPPQFPRYGLYRVRLNTFQNWPADCAFRDTQTLAESGFYYAGHADAVRCFQCGFRLRNWQAGDDPHAIHRQYSRQCDFLRERHGAAHATQEMREVNLHSPRVGSTHYQRVLGDAHRLGYARSAVHGAVQVYIGRGQSLNNLRIDHLEAILQEWRTPLCREALQAENRRLRQICMCQRCKRKPLEIMLFPCHHRLCNACVGRSTHCPICNAHIWDRLRVFM
ncbi:uncharacterized protein LOC128238226 isoform X2 [Mya arenaria]|uniref:uncharacterized protein LOC128238226 isoform X2 n=1 Tax=Mya arenaria TaxID=6604 RepID=UPI0022E168C4|nr:uncharacterized protein LOC128238226 isoform X2 [Mya arenaria]